MVVPRRMGVAVGRMWGHYAFVSGKNTTRPPGPFFLRLPAANCFDAQNFLLLYTLGGWWLSRVHRVAVKRIRKLVMAYGLSLCGSATAETVGVCPKKFTSPASDTGKIKTMSSGHRPRPVALLS